MSKRIKAIKCPHCGSTKVKETRPDYYQCKACSTEFFLDSDDININHHYINSNENNWLGNEKKLVWIALPIIFVVIIFTVIVKCLNSPTIISTPSATTEKPEDKEIFHTKCIMPFFSKSGLPVVAVFGNVSYYLSNDEKEKNVMRVYDIKKDKMIKELRLPIDKLDEVDCRAFDNGWLNVVINQSTWYTIDPSTFDLKKMTIYKSLPELQDGFASIELLYGGDSDGFKVMTNLGKERYYLPIIGKTYTSHEYYEACQSKLPNPTVRTAFAFSKETTDYPEQQIQLVKYTHYVQEGYPRTDSWHFGWCRDFGGKSGIFFGNAGSVKAFISTFDRKAARLISYSDFTPEANYFSPNVLWFDNAQLLIRYKPTVREDAEYVYQLLDANTAQRKWSIKLPDAYASSSIDGVMHSSAGFLIPSYDGVWLIGNDGKVIAKKEF